MDRPWMKSWLAYLSKELSYPRGKKPVFEYLRDNAREFPDRTAIIFYGAEGDRIQGRTPHERRGKNTQKNIG